MYEGKGPLAEDLEKFFIVSKIPYQIEPMGLDSRVMGKHYGSFLEATDDFAILSERYIDDSDIKKIRDEIKLHYIGESMLHIGHDKKNMHFWGKDKKIFVHMTPLENEIRITVFKEMEPEENYIEVPQTQIFKM